MAALTPADFTKFFTAIHGDPPFPWQQRLVEQLAGENRWPDVLDLPTGTGKTAALDAAVFHLALQQSVTPRRAALRIALVVDRRLVVDDAHRRAETIACALADPSRVKTGRAVVGEVARRLQRLAGAGEPPLVAVRLRGGAPLEHDWVRTPTQPTILCSTVDQVGSRLLFRGYGVSNRMAPVHAGLLGEDTLILLDEAHLSEPFRETLQAVRTLGSAHVTAPIRIRVNADPDTCAVVLTATPGGDYERRFELGPADRKHQVLQQRVAAPKPARLMKPIPNTEPAGAFARAARDLAERLHRGGVAAPAVGVVVNRVDLARAVFERLRDSVEGGTVELLIGRARDVDRRGIESKLDPFRTGAADRETAAPLLLVATQCLEVGVDLDLDGLVTQAAPLDALRQRFGRVNRGGRSIQAAGAILVTTESLGKRADDPVYGDRIRKTWDALTGIARNDRVDFGVDALDRRLRRAKIDVAELAAPRDRAPVLMPAYLDLWAQTSPPPAADPEVGLFLHGVDRAPAEVSLAWRSDITSADLKTAAGTDKLKMILGLLPPRSAEMVTVPIWAAAAWLRRWHTARAAGVADVPEREDDLEVELSETNRMAFRWAGADDPRTDLVTAKKLRPGDVLVVPADYGGCDGYGWAPEARDPVVDVADAAAWPYRGRRLAVRVTPEVEHWQRLAAVLTGTDSPALDELLAALPDEAGDATTGEDGKDGTRRNVREQLAALRRAKGKVDFRFPYGPPDAGAIVVAWYGIEGEPAQDQPVTEDDTLSHSAGRQVTLDEHTCGVVTWVERFTAMLKLAAHVAADLRLAALLHDAGKADERFQLMLAGADWWNRPDGPVLAKSGHPSQQGAWERAGLPRGWRHEALSVRLATADPRFADAHDPHLVLWLIGTHHGLGRPFFGFEDPQDRNQGPQSLAYDFKGLDWASLFDLLQRRYGVWGLARLEMILRLADHRASEAERPAP